MPPAPTNANRNAWLLSEVADFLATNLAMTVGTNLFVGELPEPNIDGTPISNGLYLIGMPSPAPDQYVDTETVMIDLWTSSSDTETGFELLHRAYDILQRKANYSLINWYIYFSSANGTIRDEGRGSEGNKLFSLSFTFVCRNLNNIS